MNNQTVLRMTNKDSLHFHWRLVQSGEADGLINTWQGNDNRAAWPDMEVQGDFCKTAEASGIESLLVDINYAKPDPTLLTMALIKKVNKLGFIIAVRSGLISPALFTQQINTLSTFSNGRIYLNVVAGPSPAELKTYGDYLSHDERYARTDDFLNICTQFWNKNGLVNLQGKYLKVEDGMLKTPYVSDTSQRPYIFIGGGSQPAIDLTVKYGDCWIQMGDSAEKIAKKVQPVIAAGKDIGLRFSVICRATNNEAVIAANQLLEKTIQKVPLQSSLVTESDSQSMKKSYSQSGEEWPAPNLWLGALKTVGPAGVAIVGSYEDVAKRFIEYKQAGVTHFILSGWPKLEEMARFTQHVMPIIRKMENGLN
jgi:alkanesulfonate monooxygenase